MRWCSADRDADRGSDGDQYAGAADQHAGATDGDPDGVQHAGAADGDPDADRGFHGFQHASAADGDSDVDAHPERDAGDIADGDARVVTDANSHEDAPADEDAEALGEAGGSSRGSDRKSQGFFASASVRIQMSALLLARTA